jgi:hypothetical protein
MAGYDPDAEHAHVPKQPLKPKSAVPKPKPALESTATRCVAANASSQGYSPDEAAQRESLVQQIMKINETLVDCVELGKVQAARALGKHEAPRDFQGWRLLSLAASTALAAASGGVASVLVAPMVESAEQAVVASMFTKVVASAVKVDLTPAAWTADNLVEAYLRGVESRLLVAKERLATQWAATRNTLHMLPTLALEATAKHSSGALLAKPATEVALRQFLVEWTNFIARTTYGAMKWDPWQSGGSPGAVKLDGARDPWNEPAATRSDPTSANVDPNAMGWALERTQRPMMREHYGILEIFLDSRGRFLNIPDYGMRLDNVGPNVRDELRRMGKVRDLKVNKVVRMCSYRHDGIDVDPPAPIASILITADGFIRAHDWARFTKVHVEQAAPRKPWDIKGDFGRCMDQIIEGRETNSCHIDHASENAEMAEFAEHAQNLPLSYLKV